MLVAGAARAVRRIRRFGRQRPWVLAEAGSLSAPGQLEVSAQHTPERIHQTSSLQDRRKLRWGALQL